MPLIDVVWEGALANAVSVFRRMDGVIAEFHPTQRMGADAMTEVAGEHLRTKTNAKERLAFFQRDSNPLDFAPQPSIFVIDAHRTAEHYDPSIALQRFRQRVAESGASAIKLVSSHPQEPAEPPWSGMFLMQDDENPAAKVGVSWIHSQFRNQT